MGGGREVEYRLRATGPLEVAAVDAVLREAGLAIGSGDPDELHDTYFDDEAGSLAGAGIGLRRRDSARGAVLGAKRRLAVAGARWTSDEREAQVTDPAPPARAAALPAPLRHWVEPWVLDRPLLPVLELRTRRERRWLATANGPLGELVIDHTAAAALGRQSSFAEVELEVVDDGEAAAALVAQLASRLPLRPAASDKPTHAARLLALAARTPTAPAAPATATGPALVARALPWLAAIQHAETGARDGHDAASRHAARTALRRLRGLVQAGAGLWPPGAAAQLDAHFAEWTQHLGEVRDLDVVLRLLPRALARLPGQLPPSTAAVVTAFAQAQRDAAHQRLLDWLGSADRLAATRRAADLLAAVPAHTDAATAPVAASVAAWRRALAVRLRRRIRVLPDDLPAEALHGVRRTARRLRYLLEEFPAAAAASARLAKLQQALGRVLDREAAAAFCGRSLAPAAEPLAPVLAAGLGALAALWHAAAQRARRRAMARLRRFDRKKVWRLLGGPV